MTVDGGRTGAPGTTCRLAQFYHVTPDNRFPYWVYGAQQDSGAAGVVSRSDYGAITFRDWHPVGVEECGYAAPDPLHPGIVYGGTVTRLRRAHRQVQDVGPVVLRDGTYRFDRTAPLVFSAADPHVLYFAAQVLFKTIDGGHTGRRSARTSRGRTRACRRRSAGTAPRPATRRTTASSTPSRRRRWMSTRSGAGTDDGLVHLTRDGGKTWRTSRRPGSRRGARSR